MPTKAHRTSDARILELRQPHERSPLTVIAHPFGGGGRWRADILSVTVGAPAARRQVPAAARGGKIGAVRIEAGSLVEVRQKVQAWADENLGAGCSLVDLEGG
jgi:hypothetical protein